MDELQCLGDLMDKYRDTWSPVLQELPSERGYKEIELTELADGLLDNPRLPFSAQAIRAVKVSQSHLSKLLDDPEYLNALAEERLEDLDRISELMTKYHKYQKEYEDPGTDWRTGREFTIHGPPLLYDALISGVRLPFAKHSIKWVDEQVEKDIRDIVRLVPHSLNCNLGELRCRNGVSPLLVACLNEQVPLDIVALLLENGASVEEKVIVNGCPTPILKDLKSIVSEERWLAIQEIFQRYTENGPTT
jgi:hypothetical protein